MSACVLGPASTNWGLSDIALKCRHIKTGYLFFYLTAKIFQYFDRNILILYVLQLFSYFQSLGYTHNSNDKIPDAI